MRYEGTEDFNDYFQQLTDKGYIFRFLERRRPNDWTPYEMEKKFIDESVYVSDHYNFAYIYGGINLPDGDILVILSILDEDDFEPIGRIEYRKLSQIEITWFEFDNRKEEEGEDERR